MPIAYLILIIYSFIASRIHWPLGNIALILGLLLLMADIIIQVIRLAMRKTTYHVLLLALSLCFLGCGYLFMWLNWPGMKVTAWICLILALPGIILSLKLKKKAFIRKSITLLVFVALACFSFMKYSAFYCFKHNMSMDNPMADAPVFVVHQLAGILYREGDEKRAEELLNELQEDLNQKTELMRNSPRREEYLLHIFTQDSMIVSNDLKELKSGHWSNTSLLFPEDMRLSDLK